MERTLVEMQGIVDFMRSNGVLQYRQGDVEVTLHPSAIHMETEETEADESVPMVRPTSVYDDPMLYPDGKDPIAEQRQWLKKQEAAKR